MTDSAAAVRPTKKQRELLRFIEAFIQEHGYSPSYREIMNGQHYTSVAAVALHINNLIGRGHLRKRDRSARSLEVVPAGAAPAAVTITSNQVEAAETKWLIQKVEHYMAQAEAAAAPERADLQNLATLLEALRIFDLEGAAQSFAPRLQALRRRAAEPER